MVLAAVQEQEMSERRRSVRVHRVCEGGKWGEGPQKEQEVQGQGGGGAWCFEVWVLSAGVRDIL